MNVIKYFFKEKIRRPQSNKTLHGCGLVNTAIRKGSSGVFTIVFIHVFERICKMSQVLFKVTHIHSINY